jgi:hypothetical protein
VVAVPTLCGLAQPKPFETRLPYPPGITRAKWVTTMESGAEPASGTGDQAVATGVSLFFEPVWGSWWIALALGAAALLVILTTYRRSISHLPRSTQRALIALRLVSWLVLLFVLLRPTLEYTRKDDQPVVLALVTDQSRSMTLRDAPAGASRREHLLKTLGEADPELGQFDKKLVTLERFELSHELTPVTEHLAASEGDQSAYGAALDDLAKRGTSRRIGRVFLLGDGAQRALTPFDADPRIAAARLAEARVPVDTVLYGTSGFSGQAADLALDDLEVNPTVFVKNTVVVGAKLRALGAANRDLIVQLSIEEPGVGGGPSTMRLAAPSKTLRASQPEALLPVEFQFVAQTPGEFRLSLKVQPLDGEPILSNNELTTYISVLKGGINVAYFDSIRPELRYLRLIDESPDIQVDTKVIRKGEFLDANTIESELFAPGKYDVYIIGDVPAKVFGPKLLEALKRAVDAGSGLLMTGGFDNFGAGGYAETPLADLLPVELSSLDKRTPGEIDPGQHLEGPIQMTPTAAGLADFVMRLDSPEKNAERWKSLAALPAVNRLATVKPLARLLATTQTGAPLLVVQDVGRGRSMAFGGDTTYQWVLAGQKESHQRFWQQVILWLAHKELQGDEATWLTLSQRRLRPGQRQELSFGSRDKDKQPIVDATYKVTVTTPKGELLSVTPEKTATGGAGRFTETLVAGEYRASVEAFSNGKPVGAPAAQRFVVYEEDLELANPAADSALFAEISKLTGGLVVAPEKLAEHLRMLRSKGFSQELEQITTVPLWDNWWALAVYVAALSGEWWLRKKRGLV